MTYDKQPVASPEAKEESYPEFVPPEGMKLEGESGEAMVSWKRKSDGNVCITSFEGHPLDNQGPQPGESEAQGPDSDYSDLTKMGMFA